MRLRVARGVFLTNFDPNRELTFWNDERDLCSAFAVTLWPTLQSSTLLGPVLAAFSAPHKRFISPKHAPRPTRPKGRAHGRRAVLNPRLCRLLPAAQGWPGSDSYDSTITDFEAERVAAEISLVDEASWDGLVRFVEGREVESAREEAAFLLISNHEAVLRDVTNANPTTQRDWSESRRATYSTPTRRCARRRAACFESRRAQCLPSEPLDASNRTQVAAWSCTATYLSGRIQSADHERPGRKPDMTPQAAEMMRAVLQEIWWESWEILRMRRR